MECFVRPAFKKAVVDLALFGFQLILILILVDSQAEMLSERMLAKSDAELLHQIHPLFRPDTRRYWLLTIVKMSVFEFDWFMNLYFVLSF